MIKSKNQDAINLANLSWLKRKGPKELKRLKEISTQANIKKKQNAIYRNIRFLEANGYKVIKVDTQP